MQRAPRREATGFEAAQFRDVVLGDGEDIGDTRLRHRPPFDEVVEAHGELGKKFPSYCCCNPATQPRFMHLTTKWYVRGGIFPKVSSPQSFRFTEDGKYLLGCSYSSGVSNIFRVEVATKEIVLISNAVTGLFRPLKIDDTTLLAFNFTSKGFQPVYIPNTQIENVSSIEFLGNVTIEKFPGLKKWELPIATPKDINIESLIINEGVYTAGKLIQLNSAYPIVVGTTRILLAVDMK